jgi:aminomethyltransferase
VGQEVVARLNTYQKVQRRLVSLTWDLDADPRPDAGLMLEGKRIGRLTSAVKSPHLQRSIGLGYVRKAHARSGTQLSIETDGGEIIARVEEAPGTADDL